MATPLEHVERPLPYVDRLAARELAAIDLVVVHCTELPDLASAREYGERVQYADRGTGASGHWYVDRDGALQRWVPEQRVANHTRGYNERSVGIELVNRGRHPDWFRSDRQTMTEPYPEPQLAALLALLAHLRAAVPGLAYIAGHQDLDTALVPASDDATRTVPRKLDPGPLFPWPRALAGSGLHRIDA